MTYIIRIPMIFIIGLFLLIQEQVVSYVPAINNGRRTFYTTTISDRTDPPVRMLYKNQHHYPINDSCQIQLNSPSFVRSSRLSCSNRSVLHSSSSSSVTEDEFVQAKDLEALQILFNKYCDKEGLMTKAMALNVPAIAELIVSSI